MIKLHVPIDHYIILYLKIMTAIVEFNKQPNPNLSTTKASSYSSW